MLSGTFLSANLRHTAVTIAMLIMMVLPAWADGAAYGPEKLKPLQDIVDKCQTCSTLASRHIQAAQQLPALPKLDVEPQLIDSDLQRLRTAVTTYTSAVDLSTVLQQDAESLGTIDGTTGHYADLKTAITAFPAEGEFQEAYQLKAKILKKQAEGQQVLLKGLIETSIVGAQATLKKIVFTGDTNNLTLINPFATKLSQRLATRTAAYQTEISQLTPAITPDNLTLPGITAKMQELQTLIRALNTLNEAALILEKIQGDPDIPLDDSVTALKATLTNYKDCSAKLAEKVLELQGTITDLIRQSRQAPIDADVIAQKVRYLRSAMSDLTVLDLAWEPAPNLLAISQRFGDDASTVAAITTSIKQARSTYEIVGSGVEVLDELLMGDGDKFVEDQVRLYYFTDIPQVLKALNPDARYIEPDPQAAKTAEQARRALTVADRELAGAMAEVYEAQKRLLTIEEEKRQVIAQASAAEARVATINKILAGVTLQRTAAQRELNQAPEGSTGRQQFQDKFDDLQRKYDAQNGLLTTATTEKNSAVQRRSDLDTEYGELPGRLATAKQALQEKLQQVRENRAEVARLVEEEMSAYAKTQTLKPYWFAAGRRTSTFPSRRVTLFAYPDRNIVLLRGVPEDVTRTKRILASFDRPAPQARITLWTMQLNEDIDPERKSDSKSMNDAVFNTDTALRDLRGDLIVVQDKLRKCINQEVNRVASIAGMASNYALTERLGRYFYYPREVRDALGFGFSLDNVVERPAILAQELKLSLEYLQQAELLHLAIKEKQNAVNQGQLSAKDKRELSALRGNRAFMLREMLFHFQQASEMKPQVQRAFTWAKQHQSRYNIKGSDDLKQLEDGLNTIDTTTYNTTLLNPIRAALVNPGVTDENFDNIFYSKAANGTYTANPKITSLGVDKETAFRLLEQGIDTFKVPETTRKTDAEYLTQWTLPDPAQATTLGEMLFILSLGERSYRENIIHEFVLQMQAYLVDQGQETTEKDQKAADINNLGKIRSFADALVAQFGDPAVSNALLFQRMGSKYPLFPDIMLGTVTTNTPSESIQHEMTANQKVILQAMQVRTRSAVAAEIRNRLRQIDQLITNGVDTAKADTLRDQYLPLVGWLQGTNVRGCDVYPGTTAPAKLGTWYEHGLEATLPSLVSGQVPDAEWKKNVTSAQRLAMDRTAWQVAMREETGNPLESALPHIARADEMIKRFIIITEGDLEHFFLEPTLTGIRNNQQPGIRLGTIQRESILVSNRMEARVDPQANAEIAIGPESNVLESATQLGQLALQYQGIKQSMTADKLTGTLPILGTLAAAQNTALSTGDTVGIMGGLSLLGSLAAQPQAPVGEIYAINSGSLFKVTPIFDPSGQALRFKFDYTASVNVREPDGTTNRLVPRVERHSVNTEVQLSNLEVREISRFENNTQVGIPTQRLGGLPVLNKFKVFKDIPLLGYYVKKEGSGSTRQVSLILAQTSIYPTVADIVELMVAAPLQRDLDQDMPAYMRLPQQNNQ